MEFFEAINKRRSVRKYTSSPVPDDVIKKALDAAIKAPNSSNLQPWEFYWVKSPDKKTAIVEACLSQGTAKTASHLVAIVSRIDTWKRNRDLLVKKMEQAGPLPTDLRKYFFKIIPFIYTNDPFGIFATIKWLMFFVTGLLKPTYRGSGFRAARFEGATKSTALACENFMLATVAQGYGCCPMEGFDECRVKKILKLGCSAHVVMIISVGTPDPAGVFGPQLRIDPSNVIFEV